jgi:hypothetical protein
MLQRLIKILSLSLFLFSEERASIETALEHPKLPSLVKRRRDGQRKRKSPFQ